MRRHSTITVRRSLFLKRSKIPSVMIGVSLIELIIALILFILLISFAAPRYQDLIKRQEEKKIISLLLQDLHFAKNSANSTFTNVTICRSIDGRHCIETPGLDWSMGWIIFYDDAGLFHLSEESDLLRYRTLNNQFDIKPISSTNIGSGLNIKPYRRVGKSLSTTGLPNGHFQICSPQATPERIVINIFSYSRLQRNTQGCPTNY